MLNCAVDQILQEFYTLFLARFRTYKLLHHPKQMTSEDDIKGLVSLSSFVHVDNHTIYKWKFTSTQECCLT
jgi:hypothetical protein